MDEQQVIKKLEAIIYPKLAKNILELKLINSLHVTAKSLHVSINTDNKETFNFIAREIPKIFKSNFRDIEVEKKIKKDKKIIVISSGKGGVGKSTVSTNFTVALAQEGYKVGLLDADVFRPSIPRLFGIENEKLQRNDKNKILPHEKFGVKIISAGLTNDTPLVLKNSVAISTIIQFLKDAEWGELDFLIIDMPSGSGEIELGIAEELPLFGALLVTTPHILSHNDVSRSIMMFKDAHVKILGVVENMSYFMAPDTNKRYDIFGKDGVEKICEKYNLNLLSKLPLDMKIKDISNDEKRKENYLIIAKKILEEI